MAQCRLSPRNIRSLDLDAAVWEEVKAVLTDEDYLLELAAEYLSTTGTEPTPADDRSMLQSRLSALDDQKVRIIRKQAELDELAALNAALAEINAEKAALEQQLVDIDQRHATKVDTGTIEDQLRGLVDTARQRMTNPTAETMVEVFDLLELDLVRVGDHHFEGTGNIPIPANGGEVWKEGPQRSS